MSVATYDQSKQRADVDELDLEQPDVEQADRCRTCDGEDGAHDRACPERDVYDPRGDRLEEEPS